MKVEIEWIPCAERLPDDDERVLIVVDDDAWVAAYSSARDELGEAPWSTDDGTLLWRHEVPHWAHLPEVST